MPIPKLPEDVIDMILDFLENDPAFSKVRKTDSSEQTLTRKSPTSFSRSSKMC